MGDQNQTSAPSVPEVYFKTCATIPHTQLVSVAERLANQMLLEAAGLPAQSPLAKRTAYYLGTEVEVTAIIARLEKGIAVYQAGNPGGLNPIKAYDSHTGASAAAITLSRLKAVVALKAFRAPGGADPDAPGLF